jgi:hypothetical protein
MPFFNKKLFDNNQKNIQKYLNIDFINNIKKKSINIINELYNNIIPLELINFINYQIQNKKFVEFGILSCLELFENNDFKLSNKYIILMVIYVTIVFISDDVMENFK